MNIGDGGGGVTREMLEGVARSDELPGLPKARFSTASAFFEGIERARPELPVWSGDLYLELHRGTYTTHANTKRNNRKAEALYREAEIWSTVASLEGTDSAVQESLSEGWKLILLNQFHDIIPGTSAAEIYEKSAEHYAAIFSIGEEINNNALERLAGRVKLNGKGKPYIVFNSLSWERDDLVRIHGGRELLKLSAFDGDGAPLPADVMTDEAGRCTLFVMVNGIPPIGYKTIWLRETGEENPPRETPPYTGKWENRFHSLEFDPNTGFIARWHDKADDGPIYRREDTESAC